MEEVNSMKNFTHKNILHIIDYGKAPYDNGKGKPRDTYFIALEIAEKGCIFDYVA